MTTAIDERALAVSAHRFRSRWIAGVQLGLISSTFWTIVSQLFAARIGRDAAVDWMTVAAIFLRDWAIGAEPSWGAILAGIAFHQWADFSWAIVFLRRAPRGRLPTRVDGRCALLRSTPPPKAS